MIQLLFKDHSVLEYLVCTQISASWKAVGVWAYYEIWFDPQESLVCSTSLSVPLLQNNVPWGGAGHDPALPFWMKCWDKRPGGGVGFGLNKCVVVCWGLSKGSADRSSVIGFSFSTVRISHRLFKSAGYPCFINVYV